MVKREITIRVVFRVERKYIKVHSGKSELLNDTSSKFKFNLF